MKRRNFLKLFPIAGFAAVCPAILKGGTSVIPTTTGLRSYQIKAANDSRLYFQMVGRGLRYDIKYAPHILDHVGNTKPSSSNSHPK